MIDQPMHVEFDESRIDAIFADADSSHSPGVAVGVATGGRPRYRKGFGLASIELPVLLSPGIRMRLYSVSKHFTCFVFLLLCEEGRAAIDDEIGRYLPQLHPSARQVTLRQLMGNISGLRDVHDINWIFSGTGRPVTSRELLALYEDIDESNAAPASAWIYNNGAFLLLTAAIERITGQSLEEVLHERVFEPVGMYNTLLRRLDNDFVSNSATMHATNPAGGYDRSYLGAAMGGEGGIVSTVDDMLRWLAHMDAPRIGSAETWRLLKTSQRLANGSDTGYGLGLFSGRYRGVETISHSGGGWGANAQIIKVPAAGLDVVVMANRSTSDLSAMQLGFKILDACLPDLQPAPVRAGVTAIVGVYRSPTTGRVIQLFVRDGRQMAWIDNYDVPVEMDAAGVMWPAGNFVFLKQSLTPTGPRERPGFLRFDDFGNVDELVRVMPGEGGGGDALIGCYRSCATGTEVTIARGERGLLMRSLGRFGATSLTLEYLASDIWRAHSREPYLGGVVSLRPDGSGFMFFSARTWGLHFQRVT